MEMKSTKRILCLAALALILTFTQGVQSEAWPWGAGGETEITWNSSEPPVVQDGDVVTIGDSFGGTLNVPPGATVTITGAATGAHLSMRVNLPVGSTVIWQADLIGNSEWVSNPAAQLNIGLLLFSSEGDLQAPTGTLVIEGGRIEHTADLIPENFSAAVVNNGQIVVNDGVIRGVIGAGSDIEINGGMIKNYCRHAGVIMAAGNITINGGAINSTTTAPGIVSSRGNITVTGGAINSGAIRPFMAGDGWGRSGEITISENAVLDHPGRLRDGDILIISEFPASNLSIPEGATITITGNANADQARQLSFNIPAGSTVVWKANTTGRVYLSGYGSFIVEDGLIGEEGITSRAISSIGSIDITVRGGAINSTINSSRGDVTVTGGTISSSGNAIDYEGNATVTVTGGTISSRRGSAINSRGNVMVTGGTISSEGRQAINVVSQGDGNVTVTGGTITGGEAHSAIWASGNATVTGGIINCRENGDAVVSARGEVTIGENVVINTRYGFVRNEEFMREIGGGITVEFRDIIPYPGWPGWIIVRFWITSETDQAINITPAGATLVDNNGREFSPHGTATIGGMHTNSKEILGGVHTIVGVSYQVDRSYVIVESLQRLTFIINDESLVFLDVPSRP